MNDKLKVAVEKFFNAFETVFDTDWDYTKEMLGIVSETEEQAENAQVLGLKTIHVISPTGTFLNPKIDDETENWGCRGQLLSEYRKLKELL